MSDDIAATGEFLLPTTPWLIRRGTSYLTIKNPQTGEQWQLVFTDPDLAQRFIDKSQSPYCVIEQMPTDRGILNALESFQNAGIHQLLVDQEYGSLKFSTTPVAEFLAYMRKKIGDE